MPEPLSADALRWHCDPESLPFETTAEVEPLAGVVGQDSAIEALRFGLECNASGQNIFVRGLSGSGRMDLIHRILEALQPTSQTKFDRCFVHNFTDPDRPRLITLPGKKGRAFRRSMHAFAEFLRDGLPEGLNADSVKSRRESVERLGTERIKRITDPFEISLKAAGLALVSIQLGAVAQTAIFPVREDKPLPPEEYEALRDDGKITDDEHAEIEASQQKFQRELDTVTDDVRKIRRRTTRAIQSITEGTARALMHEAAQEILIDFPGDDVKRFLSEVLDDVADNRLSPAPDATPIDPIELYGVNVVEEHEDSVSPIVVENTPTLTNLLGTIDRTWSAQGPGRSDYSMIRGGSLLSADGGYLVLEARDVLMESAAWKYLLRTLRTGCLEIVPSELGAFFAGPSLKPQPIPIRVRVILLGDSRTFQMLDAYDDDFRNLFKVLADFSTEIPREPEGVNQYAGAISQRASTNGLLHFHKTAVAALLEHGARISANQKMVTTQASRIVDIGAEAAFLAGKEKCELVHDRHVIDAISRRKNRAGLPSRRFRELLRDGTIRVETSGSTIGQINGLAVISAGMLTYGFPARITASIGAGSAGIINIEGKASLSGSIHTKGFQILGGLLRRLLRMDHPLAFSASLTFEQSYGGIDGDSASCAETCCLLSALTGIPLRQDIAITGAIDQLGAVQAIGGVNEKIEGFFDTCADAKLTGTQGVIIPQSNAGDLMLRADVVEACREGTFRVWTVSSVHEALEILTGMHAGKPNDEGIYAENTVLGRAVDRATELWVMSLQNPGTYFLDDSEEEEDDETDAEQPDEKS